jgi:hypothetical protein
LFLKSLLFFKGIFTENQIISIGGVNYGFHVKFHMDSQFVYTDEFTYTYNITSSNQTVTVNNLSNYDGYIYPYLKITTGSGVNSISIANTTDNNSRLFNLTGLTSGEIITIDNDRQIITSLLGTNKLNGINFNFLRLVRGWNTLVFNGNGTYVLKLRFLKKVGV